jgi:hypothetical protein
MALEGQMRSSYRLYLVGKSEEREYLKDLEVDGLIVLKLLSKTPGGRAWS